MGLLDAPGLGAPQVASLTNRDLAVISDTSSSHGVSASTVSAVGTSRIPAVVGVNASQIRLVFGNYYNPGTGLDTDSAASGTFNASLEVGGTIYRATFAGRTTATLDPGGVLISDPIDIAVTKGTTIWLRTFLASGTLPIIKSTVGVSGGGGFVATTDLTAPGSGAVAQSNSNHFAPLAVLGVIDRTTAVPSTWVVYGDSVPSGTGEQNAGRFLEYTQLFSAGGGYVVRAFSGSAGVMMVAQPSDRANWFLQNGGHTRRGAFTRYASKALITYGINDFGAARTTAQVANDNLAIAQLAARSGQQKVYVATVPPTTTSTDKWATVANQTTHVNNGNRVAYNNWLRAGAPIDPTAKTYVVVGTSGALVAGRTGHPFTGYFELADVVESARDSGLWKAAERFATDGAIAVGNGGVLTASASFVSGDVTARKEILVAGAGSGAADLVTWVNTFTSSTSITVGNGAATTVTGAIVTVNPWTKDGVHPAVTGHKAIAVALAAAGL